MMVGPSSGCNHVGRLGVNDTAIKSALPACLKIHWDELAASPFLVREIHFFRIIPELLGLPEFSVK